MAFTFNPSQIAEISNLQHGENRQALYNYLIDAIEQVPGASDSSDVAIVFRFLLGARQVNGEIGPFSALVRGYTERQRLLRTNIVGNIENDLQDASNAIADSIAQEIINNGGELPSIATIADADASQAVITFFDDLPGTDTAGNNDVSAYRAMGIRMENLA